MPQPHRRKRSYCCSDPVAPPHLSTFALFRSTVIPADRDHSNRSRSIAILSTAALSSAVFLLILSAVADFRLAASNGPGYPAFLCSVARISTLKRYTREWVDSWEISSTIPYLFSGQLPHRAAGPILRSDEKPPAPVGRCTPAMFAPALFASERETYNKYWRRSISRKSCR